jgi:hypothetical protein
MMLQAKLVMNHNEHTADITCLCWDSKNGRYYQLLIK